MKAKKNDIVSIRPNSWGVNLSHETIDRAKSHRDGKIRTFKVLAVSCSLPIFDNFRTANTLIQAEDNAEVIAINDRNLYRYITTVGIQYIANGRNVTMELSDQNKNAVLRAHLTE